MEPDDYASEELKPGQLLWHYTRDFGGLAGIVGGELWASSLPYLNDTQEFTYGVSVTVDTLKDLLDDNEHTRAVLVKLMDMLLVRYTPDDVFSVSFSTEEDDLSQWRAYSGAGPSFSIGFDPQTLEQHAAGYGFQLHQVVYEGKLIAADVRQELKGETDEINDTLRNGVPETADAFAKRAVAPLIARILQLAPRYKHPKFAAEKEWRLVRWMPILSSPPHLPRRYRLSGSLVVPYLAMPLHTLLSQREVFATGATVASPMSAVRISSSPHPDHLDYAVKDMTARRGLVVDVRPSAVPFRNW